MKARYILLFVLVFALPAIGVSCQEEASTSLDVGLKAIAAGLAVSLSALGGGFAVAKSAPAAIASVTEKPEAFGKVIVFVGLAEGIAIYGFIVSILIIFMM